MPNHNYLFIPENHVTQCSADDASKPSIGSTTTYHLYQLILSFNLMDKLSIAFRYFLRPEHQISCTFDPWALVQFSSIRFEGESNEQGFVRKYVMCSVLHTMHLFHFQVSRCLLQLRHMLRKANLITYSTESISIQCNPKWLTLRTILVPVPSVSAQVFEEP